MEYLDYLSSCALWLLHLFTGILSDGNIGHALQVVINPYVAAYEVRGTQPVQRMNIVCAFNSFGTTIAPFSLRA